jgi:hypothetical protein
VNEWGGMMCLKSVNLVEMTNCIFENGIRTDGGKDGMIFFESN